jgi:hypothetical protein
MQAADAKTRLPYYNLVSRLVKKNVMQLKGLYMFFVKNSSLDQPGRTARPCHQQLSHRGELS